MTAERDDLAKKAVERSLEYIALFGQCTEALAERDALKADAARYRWLRHGDNDELVIQRGPIAADYYWLPRNERLDTMIDAAMEKAP